MDSYEINKDTVALIPKDGKTTIVYEVDNSFVVNKPALKIVEESCGYFGSSLEGRQIGTSRLVGFTHKVPVIIAGGSFNTKGRETYASEDGIKVLRELIKNLDNK